MRTLSIALLSITALLLSACDNDNNVSQPQVMVDEVPDPVTLDFEVSVQNLTLSQPFSPVAVVAHGNDYSMFGIGESASVGLEQLAEGGDTSEFISEAEANESVVGTTTASGVLGPGATELMMISIDEDDAADVQLSAVTMLVNTNDAITAIRGANIAGLEVDESLTLWASTYDAGTEANTEMAGTMPGPADEGEGFNSERDDIADIVTGHSGVITAADGHVDSVLTEAHRWDNPTALVVITRIQ